MLKKSVPASATTQRRERSYALLLVAAQTGDECDTDSSEESEWLTWAIVGVVILVIIVSVIVGVILFVKSKQRREKSRIELKARQEANSWQL
jgi:flagellar basal body-associated protein FliL